MAGRPSPPLAYLAPSRGRGQPATFTHALADGLVAARPAEDEIDGGEEAVLGQQVDRLSPPGGEQPAAAVLAAPTGVAARAVRALAPGVGAVVHKGGQEDQAIASAVPDQEQVVQRDGAALLDDGPGRAPYRAHPVGQLLGVGDRGRQAHQVHLGGEVDDDLLPHRPPVGVLEVVDLVQHYVAQPEQARGRRRRPCCAAPRWSSRPPGHRH